jgi:type I restriction enzyme S subunit
MIKRAPQVPFERILSRVDRRLQVNDTQEYQCVGVRWYGLGAFVREALPGLRIKRKQQWIIHSGDVVYNKLFAWKGAFAIADDAVDGCIVSDKFPTYQVDSACVDSRYIGWYFRSPRLAQQAQDLSKGAAAISKLTLNPPDFFALTMPLPALPEQKRIVETLDLVALKIEGAKKALNEGQKETHALTGSVLNKISGKLRITGRLEDILQGKPRNGWSARCDNADDGTPILTLSAVTGFHYDPNAYKRTSLPTNRTAHYWLNEGDLLITRSNTPELVGHAAIYDGTPTPCIYPDLMMRIPVDDKVADREFVWLWLQTPVVREFIQNNAKGTSPTMKKISQGTVLNIPFPSGLKLSDQMQMVRELKTVKARIERSKQLQKRSASEVDAILPSIIDMAFRGEL